VAREVLLAAVIGAVGLKGEVRAKLFTATPDALPRYRTLHTADGRKLTITAYRPAKEGEAVIAFEGVGDRNAAEALHGATVSVPRSVLPALEPGEYYLIDLVGAKVLGPEGEIGEVTGVVSHPTVDVIVLRRIDGSTAEQPLSAPWLERVDVAARQIVLSSLDGLM
jgi:16S rRNA processing protein RimM